MKAVTYIILSQLIVLITLCNLSAQITLTTEDISCHGETDGKITASVGIDRVEYSINGSDFQDSNTFSNLSAGTYTVTVRDKDTDCQLSKNATINEPPELKLSVGGIFQTQVFCIQDGPSPVTLTTSASGGTPPYTYSWPGGTRTVSSTGFYTARVTDANGCVDRATVFVLFIPILCSRDPNDIIGPEGYSESSWVSVNDNLPYTIRFENDPEFATAPAQNVTIEHVLDENASLFSVRLGDFGFANMVFEVPENSTHYSQRLDLEDSLGVLVDVTAGINVDENKVFWIFESIDPETGLAPSDPLAGMLPVNDTLTHEGEGFVNFTMKPKSSAVTGDSIRAQASIVFDVNAAIETNIWNNLVDAIPPVSVLSPLPETSDTTSIILSWTGTDDTTAVGVSHYEVYVSRDGGAFSLYRGNITETSLEFTGEEGSDYAFFTRAIDNVGNEEALKLIGEDTISIRSDLLISPQVILQGAYDTTSLLMTDLLRSSDLLPLTEPYTDMGLTHVGVSGGETVDAAVFAITGSNAIVDWVFLELRDKTDSDVVRATRAALLQRDGDVVDVDGISAVAFPQVPSEEYYLTIRHRNHIGVMTTNPIAVSTTEMTYDFTDDQSKTLGALNGIADLGNGFYGMYSGDHSANGQVQNTDVTTLVQVLGMAGYLLGDLNLNGEIQNTDLQFWLVPNLGKGAQFNY